MKFPREIGECAIMELIDYGGVIQNFISVVRVQPMENP